MILLLNQSIQISSCILDDEKNRCLITPTWSNITPSICDIKVSQDGEICTIIPKATGNGKVRCSAAGIDKDFDFTVLEEYVPATIDIVVNYVKNNRGN